MVRKLTRKLGALLSEDVGIAPAPSIFLSENTVLEPDICLFPDAMESLDVRGGDILLAIEVSDTTLRKDLGTKARLYAAHGVSDYWVIDLNGCLLHRHSKPFGGEYGSILKSPFGEATTMPFDETVSVVLADL